ncbi:hypothetical protein ACQPYK_34525 [Streptosporangium sp. CA-135522]|uniref:hypothetical protein n=1 Tax=Streptosporangium sp. CA-135522 TaxID=3240072 RepID=UPI003D9179CD
MIAASRERASSRCRRAAPWIAILICLGLCLGWHSGVAGLFEGTVAESVASDTQPVDEVPAVPATRHVQGQRDLRTQVRGPAIPGASGAVPSVSGRPDRRAAARGFQITPHAGLDRLILLSVSRI